MTERDTVRLSDVARAAGVSLGTASNVFSRPERVRPELRERVRAAAESLGFAGPDPKGRLLMAGKVNAIGVVPTGGWGVVESLTNLYFRLFLAGVGEVCDEKNASLLIVTDKAPGDGMRNALVDGLILSRIEHLDEIEPARQRRIPFVVMDVDAGPQVNSVRADARSGCRAAAGHLIGLGHRRFAVMSFLRTHGEAAFHPPAPGRGDAVAGMPIDQEKFRGYADGLARAGIDIDTVPLVQAHPWDKGAAALLLDRAPEATAILSMSDMQAIAIAAEARGRGRIVPRDLSVVGYNDIAEAAQADPPLTTVSGKGFDKGRAAARLLFEGGPPRQQVLPTELILRASTGPAPQ